MAGKSGSSRERRCPLTANPLSLPACTSGATEPPPNMAATSPAMTPMAAGPPHMHEFDAGLLLEELHGEVMLAAVADGGVEQRRPRCARQCDEGAEVRDRGQRRIGRQNKLVRHQTRHRQQVLERID